MLIYLAGSISGQSGEAVTNYFTTTSNFLKNAGFEVLHPMIAKGYFRNEFKFKAEGYTDHPVSTNHAIFERDLWMIGQCDILYCNLTMADIVSIGSCMELACGHILRKHIVVTMQKDNIHRHAFVLEAAHVIFENVEESMNYLLELIK